jgi:hypothetical protein
MEDIIWVGIKDKVFLSTELCVGFLYNTPVNSEWFKVNFTGDLNEEIKTLVDKQYNAELLRMGDFN